MRVFFFRDHPTAGINTRSKAAHIIPFAHLLPSTVAASTPKTTFGSSSEIILTTICRTTHQHTVTRDVSWRFSSLTLCLYRKKDRKARPCRNPAMRLLHQSLAKCQFNAHARSAVQRLWAERWRKTAWLLGWSALGSASLDSGAAVAFHSAWTPSRFVDYFVRATHRFCFCFRRIRNITVRSATRCSVWRRYCDRHSTVNCNSPSFSLFPDLHVKETRGVSCQNQ